MHVRSSGFDSAAAHAADPAAIAFALRHGFVESDREVEQVRAVGAEEPAPPPYDGVVFSSVADDSTLLERAYAVASQGYADLALASGGITVPLDEWLRDEATLPGGSFAALDGDRVVGYAGLLVLERRRHESRARADRGRPRVAAARARDRAQAAAARLGCRERDSRARHLDADGQRGDAQRQRAARLRDADGEPPHAAGACARASGGVASRAQCQPRSDSGFGWVSGKRGPVLRPAQRLASSRPTGAAACAVYRPPIPGSSTKPLPRSSGRSRSPSPPSSSCSSSGSARSSSCSSGRRWSSPSSPSRCRRGSSPTPTGASARS